jgi:hypothetical protein
MNPAKSGTHMIPREKSPGYVQDPIEGCVLNISITIATPWNIAIIPTSFQDSSFVVTRNTWKSIAEMKRKSYR